MVNGLNFLSVHHSKLQKVITRYNNLDTGSSNTVNRSLRRTLVL